MGLGLARDVRDLQKMCGEQKRRQTPVVDRPLYYLHRRFVDEQDLLVIFFSKECRYRCNICAVSSRGSRFEIDGDHLRCQFMQVMREMRNSLHVLESVTLSNEGSILDSETFDSTALDDVVQAVGSLRQVRRLSLETRIEFIDVDRLRELRALSGEARLDMLTGLETLDDRIRNEIIGKLGSLDEFRAGLDRVADADCSLTSYVLFKPDPAMTDEEAYAEAERSIRFLDNECGRRQIPLTIRLNPMYAATGTQWAERAKACVYTPPDLGDVLRLAKEERNRGVRIYIGLSTEGLNESGMDYTGRKGYGPRLLISALQFNRGRV